MQSFFIVEPDSVSVDPLLLISVAAERCISPRNGTPVVPS